MSNYGFIKFGAASPKMKVADPEYNVIEIEKIIKAAEEEHAAVVVFPELCITGYTCADLFGQRSLLNQADNSLSELIKNTMYTNIVAVVGMPVSIEQKLYNCAVVFQRGKILGVVPKMYL